MTGYCIVATPYIHRWDNIRLLAYRSSVTAIMALECVFKFKYDTYEEIIFFVPFAIFGILFVVAVLQFVFLFIRSYQ